MSPSVAITGIGPISPIGIGREDLAAGLAQGRDGRIVPEEGSPGFGALPLVASCLDFFVEDYLQSEKTYLDRCSEFALAACALALEDAELDWQELDSTRLGLAFGTAFGCLDSLANVSSRVQAKGARFASPMIFTHAFANSPVSLAAIEYRIQGPCSAFCTGGTSSAAALQYAMDALLDDRADVMLAGGADALSGPLVQAIAAGLPGSGEAPGEGACLLALERMEDAQARGANMLGELVSVELGCADAGTSTSGPEVRVAQIGDTRGADAALQVAAGLCGATDAAQFVVVSRDPLGREAAVEIRRWL